MADSIYAFGVSEKAYPCVALLDDRKRQYWGWLSVFRFVLCCKAGAKFECENRLIREIAPNQTKSNPRTEYR